MKTTLPNKAPPNAATYDVPRIEPLLNRYASPAPQVEIGSHDDFPGPS